MHPIRGDAPAVDRPAMILLVLLFAIGFLISVLAPAVMYELAMTFR
jgi:hypothetical protein